VGEWGATIERLVESAHSCKCGYENLMNGKVRKEGVKRKKVAGEAKNTYTQNRVRGENI
jgi:hypothetical protein